jgi:serine carboxypeptidase-like clade 1
MLFYSGDVDGAVPTIGSQKWISTLGWENTDLWHPYIVNDQVAGYLEAYDGNLTFATIHGAGHMAPQFKREETYYLIFNWLYKRDI